MNIKSLNSDLLNRIALRAHYLSTQMIFQANHRSDKEKGDPKVGGHPAASASCLHIMGALHLAVRSGFDFLANKPHASPTDHAYHYLLDLLLKSDFSKLSLEEANQAMMGLRKYPQDGEYVFQSYHSAYDPDHHNFFPSGTVGIPPVMAGYLALAYRYCKDHGYNVPDAHFWAVVGDAEFREGSLYEAIPDFAERELGNLTWIVDYNRQSLDGHRISNKKIMHGTDDTRLENTLKANGWNVIQVRHGKKRLQLFAKKEGALFKKFLEEDLEDYELQALLLVKDMKALKKGIAKDHPHLKKFLDSITDQELHDVIHDFGGHDIMALIEAMTEARKSKDRPTLIIAHTLKGWGLEAAAQPGNHSSLPDQEEVDALQQKQGLKNLFERFTINSPEGQYLKERGEQLLKDIKSQHQLKADNLKLFNQKLQEFGPLPKSLEINTKLTSYPHTQWMLGQLTAKLTRIANTSLNPKELTAQQKSLTDIEKTWKAASELFVSMAPDVGTSTNLNPAMDGKIFGVPVVTDIEAEYGVKDSKTPDLVPGEDASDRYIRFEISEGNVMSCVGSFGKIKDYLGIPLLPLMTVYDFFIKRAHDQYFYNLYWKSQFICVGTPSGVTLSPEGAQHGWKSDFQIPNQITWEPYFCQELDWIFCDTINRQMTDRNSARSGALLRLVTRGVEQKDFLNYLKKQARFKQGQPSGLSSLLCRAEQPLQGALVESEVQSLPDADILNQVREEVLKGAYYLIDYRNYAGYEPGDNVIHIFAMGSLTSEAIKASEYLLTKGIYANVIVVTSPDLLVGNLAHDEDYDYLKNGLQVQGNLYVKRTEEITGSDLVTISGRRIPVVSVHDGEPGLLDNIGSVIGVKQISCAVRKHSKCGRPADVYHFHSIDSEAVIEACGKALAETAMEQTIVKETTLTEASETTQTVKHWAELWPTKNNQQH